MLPTGACRAQDEHPYARIAQETLTVRASMRMLSPMAPTRHDRLLSHLQANGRASVSELSRDLGVTPATIRRDLQTLADEGRLLRTYGGATVADRRLVREVRAV